MLQKKLTVAWRTHSGKVETFLFTWKTAYQTHTRINNIQEMQLCELEIYVTFS